MTKVLSTYYCQNHISFYFSCFQTKHSLTHAQSIFFLIFMSFEQKTIPVAAAGFIPKKRCRCQMNTTSLLTSEEAAAAVIGSKYFLKRSYTCTADDKQHHDTQFSPNWSLSQRCCCCWKKHIATAVLLPTKDADAEIYYHFKNCWWRNIQFFFQMTLMPKCTTYD